MFHNFVCQSAVVSNGDAEEYSGSSNWDSSVHLPVWVLETEKNAIEGRIEEWADLFESCGADIHSLALGLQKPLRPLWISQNTRIWLNEVPDHQLWDFTPVILVSASASGTVATQRTASEFSWRYIPGAGDDEESWARGLTPTLFWKHSYDLLDGGPDLYNQLPPPPYIPDLPALPRLPPEEGPLPKPASPLRRGSRRPLPLVRGAGESDKEVQQSVSSPSCLGVWCRRKRRGS